MITEDLFMIEAKGKDPFPVKNHIRLIVASNNNWVIPAALEERRFLALEVDDRYMQDKAYFKALFDQMDNGGREAMLKDLLEYELTGVDLRTIPRTKALMDQILNSMNPVGKFWFDRLKDGSLGTIEDGWAGKVESEALYDYYIEFAGKIGDRYKVSESQFGKEIKELCPAVDRKKIKKDNGQGRAYHLFFPSLEECRKLFEARVDIEIDWEV
jgi:phage/plasmid-associated DNA primase